MKKQIVTACALIASVAAFATSVESSNTFGVLKYAGTVSSEVMVSVPWLAVGGANISPANLVLASNRVVGDQMYWYDTSAKKYKVWVISESESTKAWMPNETVVVGATGEVSKAAASGEEVAPRGDVIVLKLNKESGVYPDIYLSGQYVAGTVSKTVIYPTVPSVYAVEYNLVAPSTAASVDLNEAYTAGNVFYSTYTDDAKTPAAAADLAGDMIILADGTEYSFVNDSKTVCEDSKTTYKSTYTGWVKKQLADSDTAYHAMSNPYVYRAAGCTLMAGQGAWYVRKVKTPLTIVW